MTNPPMTTIGPPAAVAGKAAVDVLIRRLQGQAVDRSQVLFKGALQRRGTVAVARAATTLPRWDEPTSDPTTFAQPGQMGNEPCASPV